MCVCVCVCVCVCALRLHMLCIHCRVCHNSKINSGISPNIYLQLCTCVQENATYYSHKGGLTSQKKQHVQG